MKHRTLISAALILLILMASQCAMADAISGEWQGKANVSGLPFSLSVTAKFGEDGSFSLSTLGLSAKGNYSTDGQSITVSISSLSGLLSDLLLSPENIGTLSLPMSLKEDALSISASEQGVEGSLSLKRK